jgi:hypothetical protein
MTSNAEFSSGALRAAQAEHVDVVILDVPASPDARRSAYKSWQTNYGAMASLSSLPPRFIRTM